jgi:hypothetical protein
MLFQKKNLAGSNGVCKFESTEHTYPEALSTPAIGHTIDISDIKHGFVEG